MIREQKIDFVIAWVDGSDLEWQKEIIHSIVPDIEITTNTWFCENMPDFYNMVRNMAFVSYDNLDI